MISDKPFDKRLGAESFIYLIYAHRLRITKKKSKAYLQTASHSKFYFFFHLTNGNLFKIFLWDIKGIEYVLKDNLRNGIQYSCPESP